MIKIEDGRIEQILPTWAADKPEVKAIGYAVMMANKRALKKLEESMVYTGIDNLNEKVLDILAIELRSPYYENDMAIENKREIIKNTLRLHSVLGTPDAVKEMIDYAFGGGGVEEWWEYDGRPYKFRVKTNTTLTDNMNEKFTRLIKLVKNTRSHLEEITIDRSSESNVYALAAVYAYDIAPIIK